MTFLVPLLVSIFYFADVLLRASEKYFWYDELFTVYFAQLRSVHALWRAVTIGIDFNPPLFYWLTQGCTWLFGTGRIAMRLPEILGFWILSLCLFRFVRRRAGVTAGLTAMLFPMLTEAYYYAYEARPHGVVLGFCGLAIVCWQMLIEQRRRRAWWLLGFGAALLGAFLMHCFALTLLTPFALVELYRTRQRRRIDWGIWLGMVVPTVLASLLYLALLGSYHKFSSNTNFTEISPAGWQQVLYFFQFLLEPCLVVILGALVLFALDRFSGAERRTAGPDRTALDMLLGLAFLAIPVAGVVLAKAAHTPYFYRYFIASVAGVSIVVGLATAPVRSWFGCALAGLMVVGVLVNFGRVVTKRMHGEGEWLIEPSSRERLDTTPGQPLALHSLLQRSGANEPIAILNSFDFLYLVHYAPPSVRDRMYYVTENASDFAYFGFNGLLACCDVTFQRPETYAEFVKEHARFAAYGVETDLKEAGLLGQSGARIEGIEVAHDRFLARMSR